MGFDQVRSPLHPVWPSPPAEQLDPRSHLRVVSFVGTQRRGDVYASAESLSGCGCALSIELSHTAASFLAAFFVIQYNLDSAIWSVTPENGECCCTVFLGERNAEDACNSRPRPATSFLIRFSGSSRNPRFWVFLVLWFLTHFFRLYILDHRFASTNSGPEIC